MGSFLRVYFITWLLSIMRSQGKGHLTPVPCKVNCFFSTAGIQYRFFFFIVVVPDFAIVDDDNNTALREGEPHALISFAMMSALFCFFHRTRLCSAVKLAGLGVANGDIC